jgi:hypothetical protein
MFVSKSSNGLTSWKEADGYLLKKIESSETIDENK